MFDKPKLCDQEDLFNDLRNLQIPFFMQMSKIVDSYTKILLVVQNFNIALKKAV